MNVAFDAQSGKLYLLPPPSKAGDALRLRAEMPLIVALSACSVG